METEEIFRRILQEAMRRGASDIHLTAGRPVVFRVDGILQSWGNELLTPTDVEHLGRVALSSKPAYMKQYEEELEADFAMSVPGLCRLRVNAFHQRGSMGVVMRLLPFRIPTMMELGLPESLERLCSLQRGLVLVTGPTGAGKTTTISSMIGLINETYCRHIITLEDPIEYLHKHSRSIVNQREVGTDTLSFPAALRSALREDPDVILVGEMRDLETISIALTAAETGHLVFSTLHTNSAADTIDRIIDVFPGNQQPQIRTQLASALECVISQQLIPRANGNGRVAAFEVMMTNPAIRNLIREGKTYQIASTIQLSKRFGMQTMDDALLDLFLRHYISAEECMRRCYDPKSMGAKVGVE